MLKLLILCEVLRGFVDEDGGDADGGEDDGEPDVAPEGPVGRDVEPAVEARLLAVLAKTHLLNCQLK